MRTKRFQNQITTGRFTLPASFLIAAACWLLTKLLLPVLKARPDGYPLWQTFSGNCIPAWGDHLFTFILYALIGYFLILLNNRFAIIRMRASVQTSIFFLLMAVCPALHVADAGDLAAAALLAALFFLFDSYQQERPESNLFHAFACIGLGSLLYPQLTLLAPVFWLGSYQFQSLHPKSFFASLVGWSVPYWFLSGYACYRGEMELLSLPFRELAAFRPVRFDFEPWSLATAGYLLLLFIASAAHCLMTGYEDKIRTRGYLQFLILLSFYLFAFMGLQSAQAVHLLPMLLICVSILTGHLFVLTHSRGSGIFFICALAGLFLLFGFNVWTLL